MGSLKTAFVSFEIVRAQKLIRYVLNLHIGFVNFIFDLPKLQCTRTGLNSRVFVYCFLSEKYREILYIW